MSAIIEAARTLLEEEVRVTGAALRVFPRGPMGLTPDAVKATLEWKAAHAASVAAFAALRAFNTTHKPARRAPFSGRV